MALRREAGNYEALYQAYEDFSDCCWKVILADRDTIYMMVFRLPEKEFVAACSFQNIHNDSIQLGYDVVAPFRGKGIGTEVVKNLISLAHATFPNKHVEVKIKRGNIASQRVTEKCGGKLIGTEDTPEAQLFQQFMGSYGGADLDSRQEAVQRGKNAVLIYEV